MVILQVYVNSIDPIEVSFCGYKLHIGVFTIGIFLCLKWLIKLIINLVGSFFIKLFLSNKAIGDQKSINNIANLILLSNDSFLKKLREVSISNKYKNIVTSLIIKNNVKTNYLLNKTEVKEIDIYLLNNELNELLELNKYSEALQLVNKVIKKYTYEISVIKYKILEVARYAKKEKIEFKFNPKKSKYKLDKEFINNYEIELEMVDFKLTNDNNKKLKIVEYLYKKFSLNKNTGLYLLQFLEEYKPSKYSDNKILNLIQSIFTANPNRDLAYVLLKLYNQTNVFEVSQKILENIPNDNIEKLWFLLIIATHTKLFNIMKKLITDITYYNNVNLQNDIINDCNNNNISEYNSKDSTIISNTYSNNIKNIDNSSNINDLNAFFIKNYGVFISDSELVKLIINNNRKI